MEAKLYIEYQALQKKALKVKGWWFRVCVKLILTELEPESDINSQVSTDVFWASRNATE